MIFNSKVEKAALSLLLRIFTNIKDKLGLTLRFVNFHFLNLFHGYKYYIYPAQ